MDTTNPAAEVDTQGSPAADSGSPQDRLESLFTPKAKQPADKAKDAKPAREQHSDEQDQDEGDDGQADDDEPDDDAAGDGQADAEGEDGEGSTTDEADTAEIEVDGKTYVVPKELEPAFLKNRDYTQKTQELAERRRVVDEREQHVERVEQTRGAVFEKAVELRGIELQLERFANVDWMRLAGEDNTEYLKLDRAFRDLQTQHARAQGEVQQLVAQTEQLTAQQRQQLRDKGNAELARDIKGWGPELGAKLMQSAVKAYDFTDVEMAQVMDPRYVKVLHDAYQWRQLQAAKGQLRKKVENVKPVTVKAARTAQTSQQVQQIDAARARARKTGNARDAEDALARMFEQKRKR